MLSAFIIHIQPELRPDPNQETAALLRVLIQKVDNAAFGGAVPPLPQWSGPPRAIVQVQALLYAGLTTSIFAVWLAILGKQWLNRYKSVAAQGSTVEGSQNRQRRLDSIFAWYLPHVMESLPILLQCALLFFGCGLSRYLWEIDTTVASVVLGIVSYSIAVYLLILVAGTASVDCPYQVPAAFALRCIFPPSSNASHPSQSAVLDLRCISWTLQKSLDGPARLAALKSLATMKTTAASSPALFSVCFDILIGCISIGDGKVGIPQGSEEIVEVSALCCFRGLSRLAATDPTLGAAKEVRQRYTTAFPFETNFAGLPSDHLLGAIHNIFYSSQPRIQWKDYKLTGNDQVTLAHSLVQLAHNHVSGTRGAFLQPKHRVKVPRWIVRFALHHLSQDPLPPTSIVTDCLSIIAIDLGCTVSSNRTLGERYVHTRQIFAFLTKTSARLDEVSRLITENLETAARAEDRDQIQSRRKAITAFFPYAVWQERGGDRRAIDAFLGVTRVSKSGSGFMWGEIEPFVAALFGETSPDSLNRVLALVSPYVPWRTWGFDGNAVNRWAAAASAVPYTEEVGQNVVDALLQIASTDPLRPYIPVGLWALLEKQPSLPPYCWGRSLGTEVEVVRGVRALGDIGVLESYLLLVWSEWDPIRDLGFAEMQTLIRADFGGIGMGLHRENLLGRLDHVLEQLDRGSRYLKHHSPSLTEGKIRRIREQHVELRRLLLEVDGEASTGPDSSPAPALPLQDS